MNQLLFTLEESMRIHSISWLVIWLSLAAVVHGRPTVTPTHSPFVLDFLVQFGYLPPVSNQNEQNLIHGEGLKEAVKEMQRFAGLPQTGEIDQRTVQVMSLPRCGLPDVSKYHLTRGRSKRFVIYGPTAKWPKNRITWSFTRHSKNVPPGTARRVFQDAFKLWEKASNKLRIVETAGDEADILIGFYVGDHGCGKSQAFDGPGLKLAHAFAPQNGDVHFDDDEDWVSEKDGISLYWTALHEFGHSLGFAHTADERSIMFPYYRERGPNFNLPEVDQAGVRYLYGELDAPRKDKLPLPEQGKPQDPRTTTEPPSLTNHPCTTSLDAIATIRGDIFLFKHEAFWWVKRDLMMVRPEAIKISQYFRGFPDGIHVDAVYERRSDQKIMFFSGAHFWLYDANNLEAGPLPLTDLGLPSHLTKVDLAFVWGHNGRAYLFSNRRQQYWRMDDQEKRVEEDYPRDLSAWRGVTDNFDAAFTWQFDSSTYFFRGSQYWKFNNSIMQTESGFPKPIRDFLFRHIDCSSVNDAQHLHALQVRSSHSPIQLTPFLVVFILIPSITQSLMSCAIVL